VSVENRVEAVRVSSRRPRGWFARRATVCTALALLISFASAQGATGPRWRIETIPSPESFESILSSVSCVKRACVAVGNYGFGGALIERRVRGHWSKEAMTGISAQDQLNSVSCVSRTACVAVGEIPDPTSPGGSPLAVRWNGSTWSQDATPSPSPTHSGVLNAVSCTSRSFCVAVGRWGTGPFPLVERWNGSRWSLQHDPGRHELNAISCTSPTACLAVGATRVDRWNGARWIRESLGRGRMSGLSSVSCSSADSCLAAGWRPQGGGWPPKGGFGAATALWNGRRWALQRPVHWRGLSVSGVSCVSATSCWLAGDSYDAHIEHWDGTAWSVQRTPHPPGDAGSELVSLSCGKTTGCVAVGDYNPWVASSGGPPPSALVERLP
jgi:hypothetical protein